MTKHRYTIGRRQLLSSTAAFAATRAVWPDSALAASVPVDLYDPFGPMDSGLDLLFRIVLIEDGGASTACRRLWQHYEKTRSLRYGEWALIYGFLWWRLTDPGPQRVKVARLGGKMAQMVMKDHPESIVGLAWQSTYEGFEALSRGVMNSLQSAPIILNNAERIVSRGPDYFYGLGYMTASRVYFKAPVFPISRGDIKKSLTYLDHAKPHAEHRFAQWYTFYAEALHIAKQPEAAQTVMANWEEQVTPTNKTELLNYGVSRIDMANFQRALQGGSYDRYLWDAMMMPLTREQMHEQYGYIKARFLS